MSYLPGIPNATDKPSQSQGQIKDNFTALNNLFGINHVKFDATDGGEHTLVTFNDVQAVDPTVAAPKTALYTKTIAGLQELFFENSTGVKPISGGLNLGNNTITFPSGLIIKWGQQGGIGTSLTTVNFPTSFPSSCLAVVCCAISSHGYAMAANNFTASSFQAVSNQSGTAVSYIAIGI
jgi:hypothetical protein